MYQINNYLARNSIFLKIKHKIDFVKKLFDYEISGRKQERGWQKHSQVGVVQ